VTALKQAGFHNFTASSTDPTLKLRAQAVGIQASFILVGLDELFCR